MSIEDFKSIFSKKAGTIVAIVVPAVVGTFYFAVAWANLNSSTKENTERIKNVEVAYVHICTQLKTANDNASANTVLLSSLKEDQADIKGALIRHISMSNMKTDELYFQLNLLNKQMTDNQKKNRYDDRVSQTMWQNNLNQ